MLDAHILRQLFLQLGHLFAADEVAVLQHLPDGRIHLRLEHLVLLFQITKFHEAFSSLYFFDNLCLYFRKFFFGYYPFIQQLFCLLNFLGK